jgi:hypothetical protein
MPVHRPLLSAVALLGFLACHGNSKVKELSPEAAAPLFAAARATPVDVNTEKFRRENGTIPGAVILKGMGPEGLPEDHAAQLVFYCSNRL